MTKNTKCHKKDKHAMCRKYKTKDLEPYITIKYKC